MDKTILKNFAIDARNQLIEEIQNKAAMIGITEEGIHSPLQDSTSDLLLFDIQTVDPYMLRGKEITQYKRLINELEQREKNADYETAYEKLVEEIAYTWFNRLIAIRFMEVNNYIPNRMRVLSSGIDGVNEPELVTNYLDSGLDFNEEELEQLAEWQLDGSARSMDAMFQFLFIKQANALNKNLPGLFEKTNDYTELLLTISYNNPEGVLYQLVHEVPEEYFDVETEDGYGQVEIIGWLYQYYNSEPKAFIDKAVNRGSKVEKYQVPAKTQLFTPDWIVKYLVENSLGRLWIEKILAEGDQRTEKEIAESFSWKYYIPEAEQEAEVKEQLTAVRAGRKNLPLEEITFMDPAMGSYHIGVYAFDVFMQLYESQGYSTRDAAESIVKNNLYGIDIDERAYQLSYFAVLMKARQYNRRILMKDIKPNLYSINESNHIDRNHLEYLGTNIEDKEEWENTKKDIIEILDLFINAKEYGSILKTDDSYDFEAMKKFVSNIKEESQISFETIGVEKTQSQLLIIISTAEILTSKYNTVITNPPYLGSSDMNRKLNKYTRDTYPNSKSDLFAVFMEVSENLTEEHGYYGMINQQSWMFLYSFSNYRKHFMDNNNIINLLHLGSGVFDSQDVGTLVQSVSFIASKYESNNYISKYIRLVDHKTGDDKRIGLINKENVFKKNKNTFQNLDRTPFSYWISKEVVNIFKNQKEIGELFDVKQGMTTSDNKRFLRNWSEVSNHNIGFKYGNKSDAKISGKKWFPYNKGGRSRKWFGNNEFVVNYKNNGEELKQFHEVLNKTSSGGRLKNTKFYFKEAVSWVYITSATDFGARYIPKGFIFDVSGSSIFGEKKELLYILGLLSSKISVDFMQILNPTMNFQVRDIKNVPLIYSEEFAFIINPIVSENIELSNFDWDFFESSWNFKVHPLLDKDIQSETRNSLQRSYEKWKGHANSNFNQLKENEEKLNEIFIDIYGLEEELKPEVSDRDITITKIFDDKKDIYEGIKGNQYIQTKEDIVKSFISYSVGCMFGRYSLDGEGLIYAGGEWDASKYKKFKPVDDNVLLITDADYFDDDIVHRFVEFVEVVYGEETIEENLEFIADSLTGRGSSREKIRNYFMNNFYKDHCQQYSVRGAGKLPIYWMYDSSAGKTKAQSEDGFKALVYMHRYDEDTTGKVRMDYLHKVQRAFEQRIDNLEYQMNLTESAREIVDAEKEIEKITKQLKELQDYDEKISHLALLRIPIYLDDGVRVNYDKVQTDENGKKLKILAKR